MEHVSLFLTKPTRRYPTKIFSALICLIACLPFFLQAKFVIGIVGKTKNDSFYIQSYKGCMAFAKSHPEITCLYDGPDDYQDIRTQALIINDMVKSGIDGLLVSTTDSDYLVNRALKDLYEKKSQSLRLTPICYPKIAVTEWLTLAQIILILVLLWETSSSK